jgi:uncharacterized protein (TIGR02246 family)
MTAPSIEDTDTDHAADIEAIRRIIADVEKGFNDNDAELLVEHFAQNASAVPVTGVQIDGRAAMLEASRAGLAGPLRDQRARYELADVVFVRPDVAVAHKHAWAVDAQGERLDVGHAMSALYVLVREDGRWWVMSRQNTLVAQPGRQ